MGRPFNSFMPRFKILISLSLDRKGIERDVAASEHLCMVTHTTSPGFCYYLLGNCRYPGFAVSDVRELLVWSILNGVLLVEDT